MREEVGRFEELSIIVLSMCDVGDQGKNKPTDKDRARQSVDRQIQLSTDSSRLSTDKLSCRQLPARVIFLRVGVFKVCRQLTCTCRQTCAYMCIHF